MNDPYSNQPPPSPFNLPPGCYSTEPDARVEGEVVDVEDEGRPDYLDGERE